MLKQRGLLRAAILIVFIAILVALPVLVTQRYHQHILISICLQIVLASSLLLIMTTGQLNMAHAAFMAIGAYSAAVLTATLGWSFWIAMPLSGVSAGIVAAVLGSIVLRLKGVYFLLVTFAFSAVVTLLFGNVFQDILGGVSGFMNIPAPNGIQLGSLRIDFLASRVPYYYLALFLVLISILILYRLRNNRTGKVFKAIAEADSLAEVVGINIMRYKVLAFSIGCIFAGLVGAIYAAYHFVISPADFTFARSLDMVTYMIVGGMASLGGPIIGAASLTIVYELLTALPYYRAIIFGVILIFVIMFVPEGFAGLPRQMSSLIRRIRWASTAKIGHSRYGPAR